ncbi:DUF292-domain-containing protein [Rickenella mellea]|uniref:DUF292-domain-containing protein n=1 Tax=Rickenella mellea TaxID=50990 RepID=A0A4Y7QHV9_9AGAM|nr:DUF292-domain-containing protein [Rickenella mellea]
MPPYTWNATKTKVQLRIAVQRLRMIQEKKEAQAKSSRRDIATLLEQRKIEKARVKVETIINDDIHIELLELLELYCELLLARFGLLELNTREPDPGVLEGVCSIIQAAPRTELKELHVLRDMLMHKFGREFSAAVMENKDGIVSERIMNKLGIAAPSPTLVDAYIAEIARGYGVQYTPPNRDDSDDDDGGLKETVPAYTAAPLPLKADIINSTDHLPSLPDIPPAEGSDDKRPKGGTMADNSPGVTKEDEDPFLALTKRFEALKKK